LGHCLTDFTVVRTDVDVRNRSPIEIRCYIFKKTLYAHVLFHSANYQPRMPNRREQSPMLHL